MASSSSGGGVGVGGTNTTTTKPKGPRHVYKTGAAGCGGKAAPTTAKNSGAPLPCPFCDRIFKQDGRLKEHLKNKHADESLEEQANGDGSLLQADGVEQGQPQQQQQSSASSYPIKTPKTLLHEWCQKNKRPVPKFKHVEEDGGFHCRVILPDPKKSEADVILWYRDTPTRSSQEAQHRAAVVGLHHVLGNRRLDRILAEEYKQQWHDLDVAAEKRKAYLKANPPQPKPKTAPIPRELHSVFMSENNRRLVEDLLRGQDNVDDTTSSDSRLNGVSQNGNSQQRRGEQVELTNLENLTPSSRGSKVQDEYPWEQLESSDQKTNEMRDLAKERRRATEMQAVRRKLLSLGFKAHHVNSALVGRHDVPSALDWLILNVPEQELPTKFAPDASKASVQVLVRGKQAEFNVPASLDQESLSHLQEYGYALADCATALSAASDDEDLALCILFDAAFEGLRTDLGTEEGMTPDIAELYDIREDEQLALESIFAEEDASVSDSLYVFEIPLPEDSAASLSMEVRIPPGSRYPMEVPVIAVRSKELHPKYLLDLTKRVVGEAAASVGGPMIYDLVHFATELAQELSSKYVGPAMEIKEDPETSPPYVGSAKLSEEEIKRIDESLNLPSLMSLGKSAGDGDSLPLAKAYVPPALRKLSSSTPLPSQDQQEVGAGGLQHNLQNSAKVKPAVVGVDDSKESAKLKVEWEQLRKPGRHADMWAVRSKLPAFQQKDSLLSTVNSHQVTIVAGQTGCGKSTQVPQYVLEDYIEKGKGAICNVICTQPRRLSAIGLADRVSKERGQAVGETVGYTVRLESNRSQRTRLLFCTTGILLRRLLSDPDLEGVTHVIVDEVHERSLDSDLLLLLLRELLKRTSTGLRLILMSATVDTTVFLRYFRQEVDLNPCVVSIPGFTFPVQGYYLEDALDLTGYKVGRNSRYAMRKKVSSSSDLPNLSSSSETASVVHEDMDNWESLAEDKAKEDTVAMDMYSEATIQSLSIVDQALINYDLIELLICAILEDSFPSNMSEPRARESEVHRGNQAGAILVFLPGVAEIRRLQKQLNQSSQISGSHSGNIWVLALHGSLSSDEQRKVFSRPSPGSRKIVLATNIAETSVTIDDVVYVIDTGRHKEMRYDHSRGISCLEETWVSKASAKQRRGRAGRVQSGYCIRLFSRQQFQTFDDQQLPEILRVSLDGLCLKVKSFLAEKVEVAASKIITPPESGAIRTSLKNLQDLNALDAAERLTPLGHHLAKMPVDARVGKMLLFGCMLRCLDPVVTIAAALSGRTPFLSPMEKREEASAARLRLAGTSKSDHLTIVSAYNGWLSARQEGRNAESNYCTSNFLSRETLVGIEASRQDFLKILADIGFLPPGVGGGGGSKRMDQTLSGTDLDSNASIIRVVKAVICAGFYPNIVRVIHPEKTYVQTEGGTVARVAAARELRFFTKADGRVFLHPASVNFSVGKFESPWLVFSEKMKTSKVFLKDSTMVPAYGLLLFGGKVQVKHEKQAISVDDWLEFEAPARIAVLIKELRSKVDSLLFEKIERPALDISSSPVVSALIRLLTTDGF
ncbi:unnamed protein product [Calypogeia fissa]